MVIRVLLIVLLLAGVAHGADFDRTLQVSSNADLYVSIRAGRIHIYPGSDAAIHIRAHLYADGGAGQNVEDRIRRIAANPPLKQSGNVVRVGDASPSERALYNDITIDYEIAVPHSVALNLRSGSGDLEVDNVGRFLKADTGSGSVRAHGVAGTCDLHSGSGDVELQQTAPGDVRASTGSGSIRVSGLDGGMEAHSGSGDIEAGGHLLGPGRFQTGSGSIRLHLGGDAHFNLDATTGSGTIRVPGSYHSDAHHLSLPVNGGGLPLQAQTGSGDIEVN